MLSPCCRCEFKDLAGVLLLFVFLLIVYSQPPQMLTFSRSLDKVIRNFSSNKTLNNILDVRFEPKKDGKSIFFIKSSEVFDKIVHLTPREACSIESAGRFEDSRTEIDSN